VLTLSLNTESQNHKMVTIEKDLWKSSGQPCLVKQYHLQSVAQDHVQTAFENLQGRRLRNLPGQPMPVFSYSHRENMFSDVLREPPVIHSIPIASGPVTGHH